MKKRTTLMLWATLALGTGALGSSCGTEVSGEEVSYTLSAQGAVRQGSVQDFTNARGWRIELTRAQALVGPMYFYSGEARASLFERLIGIQQAYACAAHAQFQSGRTLAEIPLQYGVDLLGGPAVLVEDERAEGGEVRSVELHVQNPGQVAAGNALAQSPEATYEFEGVATRDGQSVPFRAMVTLPEEGTHQIVDSISAQVTLDKGSELMLNLQLDRLFQDVDFTGLEPEGSNDYALIGPGTQAYASMLFSLHSREAFVWENVQ